MLKLSDFGRGIKKDFIARSVWYWSDWTDALNLKVASSTCFIFFTSIGPAVTFSLAMSGATDNQIGAVEVLVSMALAGIMFSIFAGQPLTIVGITGPVTILTISLFDLSKQFGLKFLPFYAWSQIWAAAILMLMAATNTCNQLKYVTRFSCEIFGILIALIYIYTGIEGIVKVLGNLQIEFASGLLQFIIAIGTFYSANVLSHVRSSSLLTDKIRELISDYGATLAIVLWSVVPTFTNTRLKESIPTLYIPETFETTTGRGWLVDMSDIPVWGVFAAFFPGLIIAILFFFDHNVSSLLAQDKEMKLVKVYIPTYIPTFIHIPKPYITHICSSISNNSFYTLTV